MGHAHDVLADLREPTRSLRRTIPQAWDGFVALHAGAMADGAVAVEAHAGRDAALPPLTLTQLARLGALPAQHVRVHRLEEITHGRPARSTAAPTRA